jgi:hypothetical protein
MSRISPARTVSVSIRGPADAAYEFLARPENFPLWASGLCTSIEQIGDTWIGQTQDGPVQVRFTPPNSYGVLDHTVVLGSGAEVFVPMRLVPNGEGCELMLTVFRQPEMTDARFDADIAWVERDLQAVKALIESL